jgi:peptidoglycan/LPS O-acetylase OafA/YrhL
VRPNNHRIDGLDGIRALAALYVVGYHIFLRAFPRYPVTPAPLWASPFAYGRFAVVVFIVVSGFSLSISASRAGWNLGGVGRFAHRRAWRILPPYWAALGYSVALTWFVQAQPGWPVPTGKSVLVNGLLLQDVVLVPSPNRTFWSIAVEAQLYVVFPLLVLWTRRSAPAMLAAVALPVLALGVGSALDVGGATRVVAQYTPDLAVLFAVGIVAADLAAREWGRPWLWGWLALGFTVPVLALIEWRGTAWTYDNLFFVDLAWGPAVGCLLVALAAGRPPSLVAILGSRPLRALGSFSYSLYLTHWPIVIVVYYGYLRGRVAQGAPMFLTLCAVVVPLTIVVARLFAEVFELPFQRRRGWGAVVDALLLRRNASRSAWAAGEPVRHRRVGGHDHLGADAGAIDGREQAGVRRR